MSYCLCLSVIHVDHASNGIMIENICLPTQQPWTGVQRVLHFSLVHIGIDKLNVVGWGYQHSLQLRATMLQCLRGRRKSRGFSASKTFSPSQPRSCTVLHAIMLAIPQPGNPEPNTSAYYLSPCRPLALHCTGLQLQARSHSQCGCGPRHSVT